MRMSRLGTAMVCVLLPLLALSSVAGAQRLPQRFPRALPLAGAPRNASGGLVFAPTVPQPQGTSDVVGLILRNMSPTDLRNQPISFGQVFLAGKVPRGSGLVARINGSTAPAQMDAKTFNPDGSVRMAVVTVQPSSLSGDSRAPVMLSLGPQQGGEVPLNALQNYNLTVDIAVQGGQTYHLDAAKLLASALAGKNLSYWLRGPLATEVRVDKAVVGSLHVTFDIRALANGAVLTDVEFKNDYALQAQGGPVTYDVTINSGSNTIFSQQNVMQAQYTQWHKLVGHGGPNEIVAIHDIAQLERTNAILDYDLSAGVLRNTLARQSRLMEGEGFGILQNASLAWNMGMVGGRGDIGPTTRANTVWLLTQEPEAQMFALAQADAAGSIPWHFYDPSTDMFLTANRNPKLWADARASREGLRGLTQNIAPFSRGCDCFFLDTAHQPDLAFIPYILTGERYYLDQLEAQATWNVIGYDPRFRQFEKGIIFFPENQARSQAWSLRTIANAAWIIPNDDPLKNYFEQIQTNNLAYLLKTIGTLRQGEVSGWIPGNAYSSASGEIIPWQQDFIAYAMILTAKRGDPQAMKVLQWQTNFLAGRFLAESKGLSPFDAAGYRMVAFTPPNQVTGAFQSWAQIGKATAGAGFTTGGSDWPRNTWPEYLQAAKGVLAGIARVTGSPEAKAAYAWLEANAGKANLTLDQRDPTWRVALRD